MHVDHHPLIHDFPEWRAQLHHLRQADAGFAHQAEAYEALDKRICRIEDGIELLDDAALGLLKSQRLTMKDDLARRLKREAGQCCGCGNGCRG